MTSNQNLKVQQIAAAAAREQAMKTRVNVSIMSRTVKNQIASNTIRSHEQYRVPRGKR